MAIIGTLSDLHKQSDPGKFKSAINYLEQTDLDKLFAKVTPGNPLEVEIQGRDVFAIFQKYETKDAGEAKMEGHRQYIDMQYIHQGIEQILVAPISRVVKAGTYDASSDLHFAQVADYSNIKMSAGMACLLYPEDMHAPGISIDTPAAVEKIVVKIAID
ncbi:MULTISPECIES: YhcH/YjgK/YiaL family protein [unclassified Carboxylicivirga]|uniref:YhcH/YjgK/YiaL family protein n=1 Tax=Carboxylicivirga TaxID=1628153 RepID=UPI003D33E240